MRCLRQVYMAFYLSVGIRFLRNFLGKVLVPTRPAHDLSLYDPEDVIIFAFPAGRKYGEAVEIATIRKGHPKDLSKLLEHLEVNMDTASVTWATVRTYMILTSKSSRARVPLSKNTDIQMSTCFPVCDLPAVVENVLDYHVGKGHYTLL